MKPGPKIQLAEDRLGSEVGEWAISHRKDDRSWRWIADRLEQETGVSVTWQHLRQLYMHRAESGAA